MLGVAYLVAWHAAFGAFDGYEVHVGRATLLYGGIGLVPVAVLYVGAGALLDRNR